MRRSFGAGAVLLTCALGILQAGCSTTSKALERTGKEFSDGNIVAGIWNGTMGVAMGALVDVFTLGGTTDISTGAQAVYQVAQSGGGTGYAGSAHIPASYAMPTATDTTTPATAAALVAAGPGRPQYGAEGTSGKTEESARRCIGAEGPSASNNYLTYFTNSCGSKVWVTWFDEDACRSSGCAVEVAAGQRQGVYRHKGELEWAACFSPARPKAVDGSSQWRRGDFRCARM